MFILFEIINSKKIKNLKSLIVYTNSHITIVFLKQFKFNYCNCLTLLCIYLLYTEEKL